MVLLLFVKRRTDFDFMAAWDCFEHQRPENISKILEVVRSVKDCFFLRVYMRENMVYKKIL